MDTAIPKISVSALHLLLGSPAAPLIIDVRRNAAFEADQHMLPSASRGDPDQVANWVDSIPRNRPIAVYCIHGHEVGKQTAASLRAQGCDAYYLEDGIEGWKQASAPLMRKQPEYGGTSTKPSKWITRERPKIDRIACPWLIRRFIDPHAQFLYLPGAEVLAAALKFGAVPYDVPDVTFSHEGDNCSFDAFLKRFELVDSSLDALATIVRGADTGKPELTPQSPGLLAISLGLSVNFPNDLEMLEHGMVMYDALYSWLRAARGEVHNASLFEKRPV